MGCDVLVLGAESVPQVEDAVAQLVSNGTAYLLLGVARLGEDEAILAVVFLIFFLLNNSKIFASMKTEYSVMEGSRGYWQCWWRNALCMAGGLFVIVLLEYIPFFAGLGPGADLCFGTTFGGPFMSLLIVFVPQVVVFSFIGTKLYRKTGNVFLSALVISSLACWVVTGGSAIL